MQEKKKQQISFFFHSRKRSCLAICASIRQIQTLLKLLRRSYRSILEESVCFSCLCLAQTTPAFAPKKKEIGVYSKLYHPIENVWKIQFVRSFEVLVFSTDVCREGKNPVKTFLILAQKFTFSERVISSLVSTSVT